MLKTDSDKENKEKPFKYIIKDTLIVFFVSLVSLHILQPLLKIKAITNILDEVGVGVKGSVEKIDPPVFVDSPTF